MPCNYGGRIVPGDRASCIGGGGTWVSEPSLMSDPTTGQGIEMTGTTEEPMENLTAYMIPGAGAAKGVAGGVSKVAPWLKRGAQTLVSKPGVVQKTIPKMKKMADGTLKHMGTKTVDKAGRVLSVPRASATAIGGASLFNRATSPNPYDGQTGPVTGKTVVPPVEDKTTDTQTNVFNTSNKTPAPANKEEVESGLSNLWSNMQKPGYWSDQVKGGAGDWDNRLFRLGEMMSYMGTPLSKRGDNPAKRWSTASSAAAELKAAVEKERIKAEGKGSDLKSLTFPQFQGNFADNFESFKENGWIPFDDYTTEEMSNIMNKAWLVHQKQPSATLESILKALKDNKQI